jgi:hypothetical protein
MLHPTDGRRALAPKSVLEVHVILRSALNDAVRNGLVTRNVALVAHASRLRSIPRIEPQDMDSPATAGIPGRRHRTPPVPALWLSANTGCAKASSSACDGTTSTSTRRAP